MLLSCQHPSTHTPRYQADGLLIKQLLAELSPDKFLERDHKLTQVTETAQDSNIAVIASVATLATYVAGLILYTGSLLVMLVTVMMVASSWGQGGEVARPRYCTAFKRGQAGSRGDYKGSAV